MFIGSPNYDKKAPLYILSADGRFPDSVSPGSQLEEGDHFLAMFPCYKSSSMEGQSANSDHGHDGSHIHIIDKKTRARGWYASLFDPIERWIRNSIFPTQSASKHAFFRGQRGDIGELIGGGARSMSTMRSSAQKQIESPDFDGWPSLYSFDDADADIDYYFNGKSNRKRKKKSKISSREVEGSPKDCSKDRDRNEIDDDLCKQNRWLGDVNKILMHGASCKSLTRYGVDPKK